MLPNSYSFRSSALIIVLNLLLIADAKQKDEQEYISSNHNLPGSTMLCKLKWVEE